MAKEIIIENAKMAYMNFSGKEKTYNAAGKRSFCVFIDDEEVEKALIEDGWNVKHRPAISEDEEPRAYIAVSVSYNLYPPKVVLITSSGKRMLDESQIGDLDWLEIEKADVAIRPYSWEMSGKSGVKAYLKSLYVTVHEDELDKKYRDVGYDSRNEDVPW